jgi:UDP-glucose 4-epimerase
MNNTILVTGGAGYIGSHTVVELQQSGYEVIIVDDLSNSTTDTLENIEKITGTMPVFYNYSILDETGLNTIFENHSIDCVIHFAAFKAVGESVENPLKYYTNNVYGTTQLLKSMSAYNVNHIVFSSSATVYGIPDHVKIPETAALRPESPYGWSKLMSEQIIKDYAVSQPDFTYGILRYFNPIGAHESGLIGERPNGVPNNLMPYIMQVAAKIRPELKVYGNDYETKDGTGARDYIHVVDLAKAHVKSVQKLLDNTTSFIVNIGSGTSFTVLEMIQTFETVNTISIPYVFAPRRAGDIAEYYAEPGLALELLGWKTEKTLEEMVRDSWNFQKKLSKS